mgnify:CR=1 FL=1
MDELLRVSPEAVVPLAAAVMTVLDDYIADANIKDAREAVLAFFSRLSTELEA